VRALVVYETACGRTREVARVIADHLRTRGAAVETVEAAVAPVAFGQPVDLLIVGATGHPPPVPPVGRSAPATMGTGSGVAVGPAERAGVREWIEVVWLSPGQPTATFDIRQDRQMPGSAARAAARRLREQGASIIGTQSFPPGDGPLLDDDRGLAQVWAAGLVVDAAVHRVG
jgi:hypothetical protein